ncbi:MAG: beta-propeller fold lactonase family protein [Hamadaea sp.]|uniref:lactonase family protein n=1 Tax=Hamadaea sp. TaxID=2024425 RepID=UPI001849DF9B|nr:beta-propeller fold lactonase family protein [Hamadaea sp.]NUT18730.1 beta-propeller fold lactonase family protein [Hamadaea sp.]
MLLAGCYTPPRGEGAGVVRVLPDRRVRLLAGLPSPSFLAPHPSLPIVYATDPDSCHLAVVGDHLMTAQYSAGTVRVHPLTADGTIGPPSRVLDGFVHPHMISAYASEVLVSDLGRDVVGSFSLDGDSLTMLGEYAVPGGPRHFRRLGDTWFITCERDGAVASFDAQWRPIARYAGLTRPSEVAGYRDRFLYVADRGPDVVAVLTPQDLRLVAEFPSGGAWPRHLAVDGDLLYVAHQHSGDITTFRLDPETGLPRRLRSASVPGASCVLPLSRVRRASQLRVLAPVIGGD